MECWYNDSEFYGNKGDSKIDSRMVDAVRSQEDTLLKEKWLARLDGKSIKFPCFALNSFFVLKCNGDVCPCLTLWDDIVGNLRDVSLSGLWGSEAIRKVRGKVKACPGCLNSWGADWSFSSSFFPLISFYLRHPKQLRKVLS